MTSHSRIAKLEKIFLLKNKQLYALALSITQNRALAEDCVHDALVAVAEFRGEIDEIEPYLFKVVRNKAIHQRKRLQNDDKFQESLEFIEPRTDSQETLTLIQHIKQHISSLDVNYQQVLIMKLFSDLTFREIGAITECSPNTVASWYSRGLAQLKERIHDSIKN